MESSKINNQKGYRFDIAMFILVLAIFSACLIVVVILDPTVTYSDTLSTGAILLMLYSIILMGGLTLVCLSYTIHRDYHSNSSIKTV